MKNIFAKENEKFLKTKVFKLDTTNYCVIVDYETQTKPISKEELKYLFERGLVLIELPTGNLIRPAEYGEHGNPVDYAYVSYTTVGTSDKAVETKFYSDGYTAG